MSDASASHHPDIALSHSDSPTTRLNVSPKKSLASLSVLPGGPPDWTRVVVTLSDELSADIISKKVRLVKSKSPVKIDKYRFTKQTRDQLLKRIPEDVLVSGVVYLPKNLKLELTENLSDTRSDSDPKSSDSPGISQIDSTQSNGNGAHDSQWHAMEQVGNELRLHYATRKQLAQIKFDQSFFDAQKKSDQQKAKLQRQLTQLQSKRHKIENPSDGLTPLGRKLMENAESGQQQREKLEHLAQQISAIETQLSELSELKADALLFSGWVNIRLGGSLR
ncbi:hypothetical protein EBR57_06085 [bacterium]|nr:hypothetical protein [bacterium]